MTANETALALLTSLVNSGNLEMSVALDITGELMEGVAPENIHLFHVIPPYISRRVYSTSIILNHCLTLADDLLSEVQEGTRICKGHFVLLEKRWFLDGEEYNHVSVHTLSKF